MNTNSHKFYRTWCSSVRNISDSDKANSSDSREETINKGYMQRKNCNL